MNICKSIFLHPHLHKNNHAEDRREETPDGDEVQIKKPYRDKTCNERRTAKEIHETVAWEETTQGCGKRVRW